MKIKQIVCAISALTMMCAISMTSFAAEDSSSKIVADYRANETMLTSEIDKPTLSFDMSDWKENIFQTKDAALANIEVGQEKTYAYQGASLKVTASLDNDLTQFVQYQGAVRDADNNLLYPDAAKEDAELSTIGVELHADSFGMNCFDGCMITFKYRINQDAQGKLLDDSVYVYPMDDEGTTLASSPLQLKINTLESNNVTQYAKGVVSVGEKVGATKIVFQVPVMKKMEKTDVLYVDNITVVTPVADANGDDMQVANIDGYNANAQPQEIVEGLKVKGQSTSVDVSSTADDEKTSAGSIILYVGIGVLVVAVGVFVVFLVKRHKNRFY